jgi:hypothetical protein
VSPSVCTLSSLWSTQFNFLSWPLHFKFFSEVELPCDFRVHNFFRCSAYQEFSRTHNISPIYNSQSFSRTLWSVISTPIFLCFSSLIIFWMSLTANGSTPAKGSSRRTKLGFKSKTSCYLHSSSLPSRKFSSF